MPTSHHIEIHESAGDEHPAAAVADAGAEHPAAAVADAGAGDAAPPLDPDAEYVHKMRGWLMTVTTLFVGMSFQAGLNPPLWIRQEHMSSIAVALGELSFDSKTNADVLFRGISDGSLPAGLFMVYNMFTFGVGIALLRMLVVMTDAPSTSDIKGIVLMVRFLPFSMAYTFAFGMCRDMVVTRMVLLSLLGYTVLTFMGTKLPALWMLAYAGIAFVGNRSLALCKIVWNRFTTRLDCLSRRRRATANTD